MPKEKVSDRGHDSLEVHFHPLTVKTQLPHRVSYRSFQPRNECLQ